MSENTKTQLVFGKESITANAAVGMALDLGTALSAIKANSERLIDILEKDKVSRDDIKLKTELTQKIFVDFGWSDFGTPNSIDHIKRTTAYKFRREEILKYKESASYYISRFLNVSEECLKGIILPSGNMYDHVITLINLANDYTDKIRRFIQAKLSNKEMKKGSCDSTKSIDRKIEKLKSKSTTTTTTTTTTVTTTVVTTTTTVTEEPKRKHYKVQPMDPKMMDFCFSNVPRFKKELELMMKYDAWISNNRDPKLFLDYQKCYYDLCRATFDQYYKKDPLKEQIYNDRYYKPIEYARDLRRIRKCHDDDADQDDKLELAALMDQLTESKENSLFDMSIDEMDEFLKDRKRTRRNSAIRNMYRKPRK